MQQATKAFIEARDQLLKWRGDLPMAYSRFRWPSLLHFNWARDHFDVMAQANEQTALRVVNDAGADESLSFAEMSRRSSQVANFLAAHEVRAGDRVLVMLGNVVPLWETMLGCIKAGVVIIPATTLLDSGDLHDRLARGNVKAVITHSQYAERFAGLGGAPVRIAVGERVPHWICYADSGSASDSYQPSVVTRADDVLLLYFTSGTTARPKLVAHTHVSYPIGHLSTMYLLGLKPGDVHMNLSSPGWAKHAWSCLFAPWNAQAQVLSYQYERFDAAALLDQLVRCEVTTFCAPPTVWRMLILYDLKKWPVRLRELISAGEPLNPEVIDQVRNAWGLTIRDGFGQTETTAVVGNTPGLQVKPGSMGLPLPGYHVTLLHPDGTPGDEGEICLDLSTRPIGLMRGYLDDAEKTGAVMHGGYYHTGDVASRDAEGYLTYVGRMDDVFKSSDYRISPFELESVLIEHAAVAEAAVVPSPDSLRLAVPKAFVVLVEGHAPDATTALSIFQHCNARVSPYKRIRRLEFATLPKTISGKIRRVELRNAEQARGATDVRRPQEFWEEDMRSAKASRTP